ncbi:hypothetical protein ACIQXV_12175 [Neobacillus sp. NPDC097160]|uniref:hypothetical protein n=1 Tax=Neobacillus sp. NPDC097160 TaxID=3364298 RepID=UPI00380A6D58
MLIVYPDADPQLRKLLTEDLTSQLNQFADFQVYEGQPDTPEEFIKRVKNAGGILLGWSIPNVVLSPHIAFNTPEASEEIFRISINNLVQFFSGNIQNRVI